MTYRLGVDIGTTFTAAAVANGAPPTLVGLGNRALQIPSVLLATDDGFLVGEAAEHRALVEPQHVIREFKRRIGDSVPVLVDGRPYSPQSLTARLLRHVVAVASERMGEAPERLVLTHPANWGPYKLELLEQVATLAGVGSADRVPEPLAAAAQYASQTRIEVDDIVAVYDLGGGTFDACVLRKDHHGFSILGKPEGIEHLGGIDFDEALFQHVLHRLQPSGPAIDPEEEAMLAALARLRRDCVDAKEALSSVPETVLPVILPGMSATVEVTRREFEELIRPALAETISAMRRTMDSAGVEPGDLRAVVLIGGSSRIPLVGDMVTQAFGVPVALDTHPKHDVALGAIRATSERDGPRAPTSELRPARQAESPPGPPPGPPGTRDLPPPGPPPPGGGTPGDRRRRRAIVAVVAVAVAAVAIGGTALALRSGPDSAGADSSTAASAAAASASARSATAGSASGATSSTSSATVSSPGVVLPTSRALRDDELLVSRQVSGDWAIYRASADADSSGERLTRQSGLDNAPALSPDRRTVIYVHVDDGAGTLRVAGAADLSGDRVLFPLPAPCTRPLRAAWNPVDPDMLAVGCRDGAGNTTLSLMRTSGTVLSTITPPADRPRTGHLAFSADGTRIAFWATPDESADDGRLYTVPVAGGSPESIFPLGSKAAEHDAEPAFSPDGKQVTFTRTVGGQTDIMVARTDGTGLRKLTTPAADDRTPTWSPDSRRIAYRSDAPVSGSTIARIWVVSSTGGDARPLWSREVSDPQSTPAWS